MTNNIPSCPFQLFEQWFSDAKKSEPRDPEAMALAVIDADGRPSVRIVLLKQHSEDGFTFFTNQESRKGKGLAHNEMAELCFYWKSLNRQIRITGAVQQVNNETSDTYHQSRQRGSQIGAWASQQSRPMESYDLLKTRMNEQEQAFQEQDIVPRPPYWGGYTVQPDRIEFWEEQPFRLHKRFVYLKNGENWDTTWLYP